MSCEHPFLASEDLVKWSLLTPDRVEGDILYSIELANKQIDEICNTKDEEISYESIFRKFDECGQELDIGSSRLGHLVNVKNSPELREAYGKVLPKISEFHSSVMLNDKLWAVIKKAAEKSKTEDLTPEQRRYVENTVKDFQENGADLPEDKKARIKEIEIDLGNITKNYRDNVLDSTNKYELYITKEEDLKGLPQSAIDAAKQDATAKGHPDQWRFSLQYPSRLPIMMYLDNEEIRHQMYTYNTKIGCDEFDNTENIRKTAALRDEKAHILGFETFADLTTNRRMAGSGAKALKFVEDLHEKVYKQFLEEVEEVKNYMKSKGATVPLKPWNFAYWSEKQRKELYDFDDECLKPYFSTPNVINGLFKITETIYNLSYEEVPSYCRKADEPEQQGKFEVWHPDVKIYKVTDNDKNRVIGYFYADFFPREEKKEGGWMRLVQGPNSSTGRPGIVCLCTNITKPVGDQPALVSHDDVSTIFHEFGHTLHGLLYNGDIDSLNGMHVPWDFVELPSQFNENFVWERKALDLFAKHYETGEKIPDELYNKMIAARNYQSAHQFMGQLYFGRIDLAMHQEYSKHKDMSLEEIENAVASNYRIDYGEPTVSFYRKFSHIFGSPVGYAGGYYSYKWAEVLDADCFSRFLNEGILNKETGHDFKTKILEKGNTIPVEQEFRDFMGRDPSQEAFLKRSGIKIIQ